jgi:acyl carrier protein
MPEVQERLTRCFVSAFPSLADEEIPGCDVVSLFDMDSLAGVTLVATIEEEFGVNIDLPDLLELGSFQAISGFLHNHHSSDILDRARE